MEEYPDPGEPLIVLRKYLERDTHKYLEGNPEEGVGRLQVLDEDITRWEQLVKENPHSRHALAGLASLYSIKAEFKHETIWVGRAAQLYQEAATIGLAYGRIRYTRELAELLSREHDTTRLDTIFERMLALPRDTDRHHHYLALVDYAGALASRRDPRAWGYFEEAIRFHPENNDEAFHSYATYLIEKGMAREATILLERLTSEQRIQLVTPAFLRKQALVLLGRETTSADAEIDAIQERFKKAHGMAIEFTLVPPPDTIITAAAWAHTNSNDDCRAGGSRIEVISGNTHYLFDRDIANTAEILYQEVRGESVGTQVTTAWTIRDRAFGTIGCGQYYGGPAYYNKCLQWNETNFTILGGCTCGSSSSCSPPCSAFPCFYANDPSLCEVSKKVCCAAHGGRTKVGQQQNQINDTHVASTVSGMLTLLIRAGDVMSGFRPDVSTVWVPPNVSGCSFNCDNPWCSAGDNFTDFSPNGPFEYRGRTAPFDPYTSSTSLCMWPSQFVCADTATDYDSTRKNYYWNREGQSLYVPIGWFDGINNSSLAYGWAIDPDVPATSIDIHIYIDGPAGAGGTFVAGFPANQPRPDVNQVTGYPGNHGWSWSIPAQYRMSAHRYYAYALDRTGTTNPQLSNSPQTK